MSIVKTYTSLFLSISLVIFILSSSVANTQISGNDATKHITALFESEWEWRMRESPTEASSLGDRRYNDRWDDVSLSAIDARNKHLLDTLEQLKTIDRAKLSAADQLNYDLFKKEYETTTSERQFRLHLIPLNQQGGIQSADNLTEVLRFQTIKDYDDWLARLNNFPTLMEQTMTIMRVGIKERVMLPKILMQRVPSQIDKQIVDRPEDSPFFKPFKSFPSDFPAPDKERLVTQARDAIAKNIIPQFKTFRTFFVGEYLPASFDQVGIWQIPNGDEAYAALARRHWQRRYCNLAFHFRLNRTTQRRGASAT
ncbi:MAG: hypothetical protein NVSMB56_12270 [Pyrinomonadaceae bacterium]